MLTTHQKNLAAIIHLSTFSQFFIPLGNFILPLILWTMNKDKSEFIDDHGKQAINFQLSLLLYAIALIIISLPIFLLVFAGSFPEEFIYNNHDIYFDGNDFRNVSGLIIFGVLAGIIALSIFIMEVVLVIMAMVKANNGEKYKYPLTINFIK
ncbi:MAG: DUF4870 domain-containing protein [Bacteroidia bacterium]|nr:DUF4870 domain-containing protein [Bacteroidia bacterium]NNK27894.1 DUF4870 domain-containing protein [Flavobacteriaceae bacterium]RZV65463.1 MAG: DUF4870 domain-containing protein [Flavobacteriaceae bacterium]RZW45853.1 MAG: DUF4870 domain-containing protein [Flavobacteriaceae bacterium]